MFYAPVDNLLLIMQQSVLGWKRKPKSFENQPTICMRQIIKVVNTRMYPEWDSN